MLQAFRLSHTVDPRVGPIFRDVSLSIGEGEKVALVGPNGGGKSLLLAILAGRLRPTSGRIIAPVGVGYLPQDFDLEFAGTLHQLLHLEVPEVEDYRLARTLSRVGLAPSHLDQSYRTLSLGERMRGALTALLVREPSLLLLDEPTNHLDADAREWLTEFLRNCSEGVLFSSHDRVLADAVPERVLELDRGSLQVYTGNLSEMRREKELRASQLRAEYERQMREDRRLRLANEEQLQRAEALLKKRPGREIDANAKGYYRGVQARMSQRAAAIRSRREQAQEDHVEKPFDTRALALDFPSIPLRSTEALRGRDLTKAYGPRLLFRDLNLTVQRGDRLAILGANGAGKTTLFRILLGEEQADAGTVVWSPDARTSVLSQARDRLHPDLPAHEAIDGDRDFVRTALARLGLRGPVATRPIGVLSVGERTKAEIVAMLAEGANVLFLDEPTNHLDLASMEALEEALMEFPGVVIFTSHDAEFVARVATDRVHLGESGVTM